MPIKDLSPSLFFARQRISPNSPERDLKLSIVPAIGLIPAASAFLKNLTMPNILFKSDKATAGILSF